MLQKSIKGFEDYFVYEDGSVISTKSLNPIFLKPDIVQGYAHVYLIAEKGSKPQNRKIHRLVAEAFIPNPEDKPMVNHMDSDKLNNHKSNLEWVTDLENKHHSLRYRGFNY